MNQFLRHTALAIQRLMNQFDPSALRGNASEPGGAAAAVFILAVPRSGTTLLYQMMARSMEFCVITNAMALAPRFMLRLATFSNARVPGPEAPLLPGTYGFLPGFHGLSEAGKVMERWFDPGGNEAHRRAVRAMFAALEQRTGRPLLIKSLSLVNRIDALASTLPYVRIVILRRDPRFVVRSLVDGNTDQRIPANQWEGVRPPRYDELANVAVVRRTAWQVAELAAAIRRVHSLFDASQIAELTYEDLCADPRRELARVAARLGRPFHASNVPAALHPSRGSDAAEKWIEIELACREFGL